MEINELDGFSIKKKSIDSKESNYKYICMAYQNYYLELVKAKDFEGCLSLWKSGYMDVEPKSIGYRVEGTVDLMSLAITVNNEGLYEFDLNWVDTSGMTDMSNVFYGLNKFNCDISGWDTSNVVDMSAMFGLCNNFNGDISKWDVSKVRDMSYMFLNCYSFNRDLGDWDVRSVIDMNDMFDNCINFNQDISRWDVNNVETMNNMFYRCYNFNQPVGKWNVGNVKEMKKMFDWCDKFNQDLNNWWYVRYGCEVRGMLGHCQAFDMSNIICWGGGDIKKAALME